MEWGQVLTPGPGMTVANASAPGARPRLHVGPAVGLSSLLEEVLARSPFQHRHTEAWNGRKMFLMQRRNCLFGRNPAHVGEPHRPWEGKGAFLRLFPLNDIKSGAIKLFSSNEWALMTSSPLNTAGL